MQCTSSNLIVPISVSITLHALHQEVAEHPMLSFLLWLGCLFFAEPDGLQALNNVPSLNVCHWHASNDWEGIGSQGVNPLVPVLAVLSLRLLRLNAGQRGFLKCHGLKPGFFGLSSLELAKWVFRCLHPVPLHRASDGLP